MRQYVTLLGNSMFVVGFCEVCHREAFIIDGHFKCCDAPTVPRPEFYKRECMPQLKRRRPPPTMRRAQIEAQENKCFYCQREFGQGVMRKGRYSTLRPHFDHLVPFDFSQNNRAVNFVAACHVCNMFKGNKCFRTISEAKNYLQTRWAREANNGKS